jgi:hypothetical protein
LVASPTFIRFHAKVSLTLIDPGWKTFSSGVISGFETVLDVGEPILKNLTQEAEDYVNSSMIA